MMTVRRNWRDEVACRDADPDLFFPIGTRGPALRQIDEAKRICRTRLERTACLAWALDHEITGGIWGGAHRGRAARHPEANRKNGNA